jgi:glycosyltransferase involved in cell wall biosynthesis
VKANVLRVLHFIYDDPANPWVGGGGAVRVRELYSRLQKQVDVTVVTGSYPGAKNGVNGGVNYVRLGTRSPYWLSRISYAAAANRMIRSANYDAALFDFSGYTPLFLPGARNVGVVLHHMTSPTAAGRWGSIPARGLGRLERSMLRRAKVISATSDAARDAARETAPGTPIHMVSAGVPPNLFNIERKPESFILYFGRLDVFHKGIDVLLDAVKALVGRRPDVDLRIEGRGSAASNITAMIEALGISANVRVLGAVSDEERDHLLSTAAIQVMPSRFEGFGLAAAEAMAAGVPLIATRVGSLPEVVDEPRGGVLVESGDPAALADAIDRLLSDSERRAALSASARESARRFDWSRVADDHLRFLKHVAGVSAA